MKGFIFVDDGEIGMRFAVASAFRELSRRHSITIVNVRTPAGTSRVSARFARDGLRSIEIEQHDGRFWRRSELFDVSCVRYRGLSPSFEERARNFAEAEARRYQKLQRLAASDRYDAHRAGVERKLGLHPAILELTLRERPDFFVIPSALLDRHTDDALQVAHAFRIPSALLVAGWDNPSSKGLLYYQPTTVGVWGEQSKTHVVDIQRVPRERVHVIGAPHYESFREPVNEGRSELCDRWGLPADVPILLFAGTFRLFDETALLLELEDSIERGRLPRIHVLYRPHPWRQRRDGEENFLDRRWQHITLDPTMRDAYQSRERSQTNPSSADNFLERMTHLRELYHLSSAVVTPMSSVLLESMIMGLPVMAIAFGDGRHSWSADRVSRMLHFQELYEIPEVAVVRQRSDFFPALERLLGTMDNAELRAKLQASALFFHLMDAEPYAVKVADLVDRMLAAEPAPSYEGVLPRAGKTYATEAWLRKTKLYRTASRAVRRLGALPAMLRT